MRISTFDPEFDAGVTVPRQDGVSLAPYRTAQAAAPAQDEADPAIRFKIDAKDILGEGDIKRLRDIAIQSATFKSEMRRLQNRGVTIRFSVARLSPEKGGGTTYGPHRGKQMGVTLDPATVKPGYHILDVYIHEICHIVEEHRELEKRRQDRWSTQYCMNRVQGELGIRLTPDSHQTKGP